MFSSCEILIINVTYIMHKYQKMKLPIECQLRLYLLKPILSQDETLLILTTLYTFSTLTSVQKTCKSIFRNILIMNNKQ